MCAEDDQSKILAVTYSCRDLEDQQLNVWFWSSVLMLSVTLCDVGPVGNGDLA